MIKTRFNFFKICKIILFLEFIISSTFTQVFEKFTYDRQANRLLHSL